MRVIYPISGTPCFYFGPSTIFDNLNKMVSVNVNKIKNLPHKKICLIKELDQYMSLAGVITLHFT